MRTPLSFGEAIIGNWQGARLIKKSVLKPVFTTIEQGLALRIMGKLAAADVKSLREVLAEVIA